MRLVPLCWQIRTLSPREVELLAQRDTSFAVVELVSGQSALSHQLPAEPLFWYNLCEGLVGENGTVFGQNSESRAASHSPDC